MINHRIASRQWRLLPLSVTALFLPIISFSQTYKFLPEATIALASNGFAYDLDANPPVLSFPGQTTPMSQIVVGYDSSFIFGIGQQDGHAYEMAGAILPGQTMQFSQLASGEGWGETGQTENSGGSIINTYSNSFYQVVGLGANDGKAYLVAFNDNNGNWHGSGILPYANDIAFTQLYTVVGNSSQLQVIGKGTDNQLYLTAWQDSAGHWNAAGLLPGQSPGFSFIATAPGNLGNAQVLGLGASDGYIYLPDWQDQDGNWYAAGVLPGQSTPLENIVAMNLAYENDAVLAVGGLGASDHILRITDWQDGSGTWHAYDASTFATQAPQVPMSLVTLQPNNNFYGIGLNNNHLYLLSSYTWQNNTWNAGYDITAAATPPAAPALSSSVTGVKTGVPFTLSWTVPTGTIDHYDLELNGTILTTLASSTTSVSETGTVAAGDIVSYTYTVRACSAAQDMGCGPWSNAVAVTVSGGIPKCKGICP